MMPPLDEAFAARLAEIACAALVREYPNHLTHFLNSAEDARAPRALHPAFYGALDWHSAVHNHWLLARLVRRFPEAAFASAARTLLEQHLSAQNIAAECGYLAAPGREGFERPYGWAWLLALDDELAAFPALRKALSPLVELIAGRIAPWLATLPYPVRSGEHANTAFALGLMQDWAAANAREEVATAISAAAERFYATDRTATIAFEPSGQDFISPILSEADLMARLLSPEDFAEWLAAFLPDIPVSGKDAWLAPAFVPESADYKLAHLAGLNLSRAWMLAGIAARLPPADPHGAILRAAAEAHAAAGLPAARREDYGASHWLPTFAAYCLEHPSSAR